MVGVLRDIEAKLLGAGNRAAHEIAREHSSSPALLRGVLELRRITSPRDSYVHEPAEAYIRAHSALQALCQLLGPTEVVVAVSLDGGSSGRCTAVVTNQRVIELQLARWRQPEEDVTHLPHFLADLFFLAEDPIHLQPREMYVLDPARPRQVLETTRSTVGEILSRTDVPAQTKFASALAAAAPKPVPVYWAEIRSRVALRDIGEVAPRLRRSLSRLPDEGHEYQGGCPIGAPASVASNPAFR
jgi:hypothetical protein